MTVFVSQPSDFYIGAYTTTQLLAAECDRSAPYATHALVRRPWALRVSHLWFDPRRLSAYGLRTNSARLYPGGHLPPTPLPLERWAARSPRTRWPLVLLLIVLLIGLAGGLTACGGGDPEPAACPIEWVTLPDGRVVQAPNNCPPDCLNHPELCKP